jgi:hypothetical protein
VVLVLVVVAFVVAALVDADLLFAARSVVVGLLVDGTVGGFLRVVLVVVVMVVVVTMVLLIAGPLTSKFWVEGVGGASTMSTMLASCGLFGVSFSGIGRVRGHTR